MDSGLSTIVDTLRLTPPLTESPELSGPLGTRIVSVGGEPVRTASGRLLEVDGDLDSARDARFIVVPSVAALDSAQIDAFLAGEQARTAAGWLADRHADGASVGGACTSTLLLAEAGILAGSRTTVSWWLASEFSRRYPDVELEPGVPLMRTGRVLCAGSSLAQFDLALALVADVAGEGAADTLARFLSTDERPSASTVMKTPAAIRAHGDVVRAEIWIRSHLSRRIHVEDVAAAVGMSISSLVRRFRVALGVSPNRFVQRIRVERAVQLLRRTSLSLEEIAARVGYQEPATLRRLVRRETGVPPSAHRPGAPDMDGLIDDHPPARSGSPSPLGLERACELAEVARRALGACVAGVSLFEPDHVDVMLSGRTDKIVLPSEASPCLAASKRGPLVVIPDRDGDPMSADCRDTLTSLGVRMYAGAVLGPPDSPAGELFVGAGAPGDLDEDRRWTLSTLARQASAVLGCPSEPRERELVVVCAQCRLVRQDERWVSMETAFEGSTRFSHGLCTGCAEASMGRGPGPPA
jgi:transcriptional regulator GlxA family with amidase domain